MKYYVDTNILLRLFLNDLPQQTKKATNTIEHLSQNNDKLYIELFVIEEFLYVSLGKNYHRDKETVVDWLLRIIETDQYLIENVPLVFEALLLFKEKSIDFVDCLLLVLAQKENCKVLSFDKDFDKIDSQIRLEPN